MDRKQFVSLMGLASIGTLLPLKTSPAVTRYFLVQDYIKGFRHYDGPDCMEKMRLYDPLIMQREPANEYDEQAIALYWKKHKLGYVPRAENLTLSRLLDTGLPGLGAMITAISQAKAPWQQLHFGIYICKEESRNPEAAKLKEICIAKYQYSIPHLELLIIE